MAFSVIDINIINRYLLEDGYDPGTIPNLVKKIMVELILDGPLRRGDLVKRLHSARTTVYDHLNRLIRMGWVQKFRRHRPQRGHPPVFFKSLIDRYGNKHDKEEMPLDGLLNIGEDLI